ncbi:MAG TPA: J domain-containing protein [Fimbriimonadaceae bacterium]|nr:J domain-containing protein [Fimbriimonadaceae bacterium]
MDDHYQTLGVSEDASRDEIRSAFRRIAREHHPDVSDGPSDVFLLAKEAYEVLIDPDRRRTYDSARAHERKIEESKRKAQATRDSTARKRYEQAQADQSQTAEVLRMNVLLNSHRFREAENVARQILRTDPKSGPAYAALAEAAMVRGDLDSAARYYAYAAQYSPENRVYRDKSIAAQEALLRREQSANPDSVRRNAPIALGAGAFVVLVGAIYVVLANEPPVLPSVRPIAAWPLSLIFMLVLAGLSVGAALSIGGALDVYDANRGSAVMRVPPATALGAVALLSFWIAVGFYLLVGVTQHAFNASMSRLIAAVFVALLVFVLAAWNLSGEAATETFLWGGNLIYVSAAAGWFVADSLKRGSG